MNTDTDTVSINKGTLRDLLEIGNLWTDYLEDLGEDISDPEEIIQRAHNVLHGRPEVTA